MMEQQEIYEIIENLKIEEMHLFKESLEHEINLSELSFKAKLKGEDDGEM